MTKVKSVILQNESSLGLGVTALLWGITFPLLRIGTNDVPAEVFVAWRFLVAALALSPMIIFSKRIRRETWRAIPHCVLLSFLLYLCFYLQTKGMETVSSSRGAFLTAISVLLVPFLGPLFGRPLPGIRDWIGVGVAILGLYFLLSPGNTGISAGDLWVLTSAVSMALYMHFLQRVYSRGFGDLSLSFLQIAGTALIAWIALPLVSSGSQLGGWTPSSIMSLLLCALLVTVGSFFLHTRYQKRTSPEYAALIFCLEPVFATLFGFVLLGEGLTLNGLFGSLLILGAIVGTEILRHRVAVQSARAIAKEQETLRHA